MLRRAAVIVCLLLVIAPVAGAQPEGVSVGPPAAWVQERELDPGRALPPGSAHAGVEYLLLDFQDDLRRHENYFRQAVRIVTQEGVGNASDVMASFDPREGSLTFHHVRLHRDGQVLDRLDAAEIRSYQRENRLEWGIYDGLETAVLNLHDVRLGDVVDFAYTVNGVHPLLDGHVSESYAQASGSVIGELALRLLADPAVPLRQRTFNGGEELAVSDSPHGREYAWRGRDLPALIGENAVPTWWNPAPRVSLTSFADWRAVVDWALPLYRLEAADRAAAAAQLAELPLPAGAELPDRVLAAVRFVQDEVRYLGREEGLWALQPRQPARCLERRFGDCKDKSLLLIALLRELGLEAFPLLVSTSLRERVEREAPSPLAFDHCVVGFELAEARFYVDPTLDHQGGGLGHHYFPDFRRGLPVVEAATGLIDLPEAAPLRIEIDERFEVAAVGEGDVDFRVDTTYRGEIADARRAMFAGANLAELGQSFTGFYSAAYPGIELAEPVSWIDEDREGANTLVVSEHYLIRDAWSRSREDSSFTFFEVYPLELENFTDLLPSPARTAPYDPGSRVDIAINSVIVMPEPWPVDMDPVLIEGDGYRFEHAVTSTLDEVDISYRYRRDLRTVAAADTPAFLAAHDGIVGQLGISVFDRLPGAGAGEMSLTAALLLVLTLVGGGIGAFFLWRRYDPEPPADVDEPRSIGGWLVLPTIGFCLAPLVMLGTLASDPAIFQQDTWTLADAGVVALSPPAWKSLLAFELMGNALILVMSALVIAALFERRTSAPRLAVAYMLGTAVFVTLDALFSMRVLDGVAGGPDTETAGELVRAWSGTVIWVPYFLQSQRVRETFVRRAPTHRAAAPAPTAATPPA